MIENCAVNVVKKILKKVFGFNKILVNYAQCANKLNAEYVAETVIEK